MEERTLDSIVEVTVVRAMRWQEPGAESAISVKPGEKVKCKVRQLRQLAGSPAVDGVPGAAPMALEDAKAAAEVIKALSSTRRHHIVSDQQPVEKK